MHRAGCTGLMSPTSGSEEPISRESYVLQVTREGAWWIVGAPAVDYRTQARTIAVVDQMGRDLIAGALDVSPRFVRP